MTQSKVILSHEETLGGSSVKQETGNRGDSKCVPIPALQMESMKERLLRETSLVKEEIKPPKVCPRLWSVREKRVPCGFSVGQGCSCKICWHI